LGVGNEAPAQAAEPPNKPKISPKSSLRADSAPHKSKVKQRIIIVAAVTVIALALPTGFIIARRRMAEVRAPNQVASSLDSLPVAQPGASTQPAAVISATPFDVVSVEATAPPAANRTSTSTGPIQHPASAMKTAMGAMSRPVFRSSQVPTPTEPPLIAGTQTKDLDLGKALPEIFTPPPLAGSAPPRGKTVSEPKLISSTRPLYPPMARLVRTEGMVTVSMEVDPKGNVVSANAISGPMVLRQAAIDAVRQWKYSPALIDGRPAAGQVTVDVNFRLN
jgi:TonB family protein